MSDLLEDLPIPDSSWMRAAAGYVAAPDVDETPDAAAAAPEVAEVQIAPETTVEQPAATTPIVDAIETAVRVGRHRAE